MTRLMTRKLSSWKQFIIKFRTCSRRTEERQIFFDKTNTADINSKDYT